jgi:hypothetical protein
MCGSDCLAMRKRTGLEVIVGHFTNRRKYFCLICKHKFRAQDRRRRTRLGEEYAWQAFDILRILKRR